MIYYFTLNILKSVDCNLLYIETLKSYFAVFFIQILNIQIQKLKQTKS